MDRKTKRNIKNFILSGEGFGLILMVGIFIGAIGGVIWMTDRVKKVQSEKEDNRRVIVTKVIDASVGSDVRGGFLSNAYSVSQSVFQVKINDAIVSVKTDQLVRKGSVVEIKERCQFNEHSIYRWEFIRVVNLPEEVESKQGETIK